MTKEKEAPAEETIAGITKKEIRKHYFEQKVKKLMNTIMADRAIEESEMQELEAYLAELKAEDQVTTARAEEAIGLDADRKPPSVAELREGVSDAEWRDNADKAIKYVQNVLDVTRNDIAKKKTIPGKYWLDTAVVFMSFLNLIDQDRVFKDQLYRAKISEIIDDFGTSRKEAEDRARITTEYADYKNAVLLRERIDEFINLAKKKDAENPYRT